MDLLKTYKAVDAVLDTLDFNTLFTGFHKYKYAMMPGSKGILKQNLENRIFRRK